MRTRGSGLVDAGGAGEDALVWLARFRLHACEESTSRSKPGEPDEPAGRGLTPDRAPAFGSGYAMPESRERHERARHAGRGKNTIRFVSIGRSRDAPAAQGPAAQGVL